MRLKVFVAAALSLAAPVAAQRDESMGALAPAVQAALDRGALLYLFDEAAWHGTDDVTDHFAELMPLAGGYVVSGEQADIELAFYDKAKSRALYRAKFADQKMISSGPPAADRVALTLVEQRLIAARTPALKAFEDAKVGICSKSKPNIALLPPTDPTGPVRAYLMTPRTSMKSLPMGGHFEVDVSDDGKAGPVRAFTKSCLEMSLAGEGKGKSAALVVGHLLDPTPTEIHVFSSMSGVIPIYVITTSNKRTWVVEGSRIRLLPSTPTAKR
jgi:hypothetical protein